MPLYRNALIALLTCVVTAAASSARPIDMSIRTSVDAAKSAQLIKDEVHGLTEKLTSDNPADRTAGRNGLMDLATASGGQQPSIQYLDTLAAAVNQELTPLATSENVLVRLNVAIIVAKIANKADNARLSPVVLILLNDKNEAVLLWALRAARDVAPAALRDPLAAKNNQLLPMIVQVAQAHPSPAIVQEAYQALMLNHLQKRPADNIWKPMVATAVAQMSQLLQSRLAAYQNGVPPDPLLDKDPANFLVHPNVFKNLSREQAAQAMQLVCDLMALAAQRSTTANGAERDSLIRVVKDTANALQASADILKKGDALKAVLDPLRQANQQTPNLPELVSKVAPAIQAIGVAVTPTTLPTTTPAK